MISTESKILIVGPGALGTLFAVRLGRKWPGVYLLDHREDRAVRMQESGLHLTGVSLADWTPPPGRVRAAVRGWPVMDVVLFFVKAPAFAAAWKAAGAVSGPQTIFVVFSEAVDPASMKIGSRAGRIVLALTEDRARVEGLGRVVHESRGELFLDARSPLAGGILPLFDEAQIRVSLDKKVAEKRWITLLAQTCVDVPAALTSVAQGRILETPLSGLSERLLTEVAAAAGAMKRPVTLAALRERRDALVARAPGARSPLGGDLLRGRPTERKFLLDPLLAAAKKKKLPVPFLSSMDRLLRRLEKEPPVS